VLCAKKYLSHNLSVSPCLSSPNVIRVPVVSSEPKFA